jgi:Domain of unknown function (DUF397)
LAIRLRMAENSLSEYNGNCVEVANLTDDMILVRDSKNPQKRLLKLTTAAWHPFIRAVHLGEFDRRPPGNREDGPYEQGVGPSSRYSSGPTARP